MAKGERDERLPRFGERLREFRKEKGMSSKQLADASGLSERAIIKWERGEREPGWFNVLALCGALGVDCSAFAVAAGPRPGCGRARKSDADPAGQDEDKPARRKGERSAGDQ